MKDFKKITDSLKEEDSTTNEITVEIVLIENKIKELEGQCLEGKTSLISGSISFIQTKISSLTITVNEFTSNLKADTTCKGKICSNNYSLKMTDCGCYCFMNCPAGTIYNFQNCRCSAYNESATIYTIRSSIISYIKKMSSIVYENVFTQAIIYELHTFSEVVIEFTRQLENNFDRLDLVNQTSIIREIEVRYKNITKRCDDFLVSGSCPITNTFKGCDKKIEMDNCTCYNTSQVAYFFETVTNFTTYEYKILSYTGRGNATEIQIFEQRAMEIRTLLKTVYDFFKNESYTEEMVITEIEETRKIVERFCFDWDEAYNRFNPSYACVIATCPENNQIKNYNYLVCKCITIDDYDKLKTIMDEIDGLADEIRSLNVNSKANETLFINLKKIKEEIPKLYKYVKDYSKNLDIIYVQLLTYELNSWYKKIKTDIAYFKEEKPTTICNVICPNDRWIYDSGDCSCTCNVSNCTSPIQNIDYYNCKCAADNRCAKTQAECTADGGKILDYFACQCKPKPQSV